VQIVADSAAIRLEPQDAGDEPFLLARRLPGVPVVVGASRYEAARLAIDRFGVTAIVLDDGFQHRTLRKDLEIVMVRARSPWGNGQMLPGGPLREPLTALGRADLVVAAGAEAGDPDVQAVTAIVERYAPGRPVLAARYVPVECWHATRTAPVPLSELRGARLVAFAGIASPAAFRATLDELGVAAPSPLTFPDHHWYSERDLARLEARAAGADGLVTTEKDWVRLRHQRLLRAPLYVVRVALELISGHAAWAAAFERACRRR
jgi:tetraacyldisaccharide 4'-kinase